MFDDLKATGEGRDLDTWTLTNALLGMINWAAHWHRGQPDRTIMQATMVDLVLHGLLVDAGARPAAPAAKPGGRRRATNGARRSASQ